MGSEELGSKPNYRYLVSFWAKTTSGEGYMRTNFYVGARYGFPQVGVDLVSDGKWHRYEVEMVMGDFPVVPVDRKSVLKPTYAVRLAFRI